MYPEVLVVGIAVLVALAVMIGLASAGPTGRHRAWQDIADERRRNWEERQRIEELYEELECCRRCPFRDPAVEEDGRAGPWSRTS